MTPRPSSTQPVSEEATRWFLRLREPACTEQDRQDFAGWIAIDPRHRQEYDALTVAWDRMLVLTSPPIAALTHLQQRMDFRCVPAPPTSKGAPFRLALMPVVKVAAMVLLVVGMAWWWTSFRTVTTAYRTAKGEQQLITLADGTLMDLNTDTAVTVHFSGRGREVVIDRGEAYFTVAKDRSRPFEVIAAAGRIQDIGTQFSVQKQEGRVVVTVEEGEVRIDLVSMSNPSKEARVLTRGERAAYTSDGTWTLSDRVDPGQVALWRHGMLLLDDVPLADALHEVNRYWPRPIMLADPTLGSVRITGRFNTRNLDEFFLALPRILPVEVFHRAGDVIITRK